MPDVSWNGPADHSLMNRKPASSQKPRLVVLAGPTAAGKTEAGIRLARLADAEIVSADSVQVYRRLDIGSAKPTLEQRAVVRHHLIDVADPDETMSAARYASLAHEAIADILARGRRVVVVGGTGLYLRALLHGLVPTPPADPAVRRRLREYERTHGPGALHARLAEVDPQAASRIHPADLVRLERALEVWELTGRPLSELQRAHSFCEQRYEALFLVLDPGKEELEARIRARVEEMYRQGLLEEVAGLLADGYPAALPALRSPGYRQAVACVLGRIPEQEAKERTRVAHRRYARRQRQWFRKEPGARWYHGPQDLPYEKLAAWLSRDQDEESR